MIRTAFTLLMLVVVIASQAVAAMSHVHEGAPDSARPHFHLSEHSHSHGHHHSHSHHGDHHHHHNSSDDADERSWSPASDLVGHAADSISITESEAATPRQTLLDQLILVCNQLISPDPAFDFRIERFGFVPDRQPSFAFAHALNLKKIRLLL